MGGHARPLSTAGRIFTSTFPDVDIPDVSVSEYVLGCFGGAGGQHACLVADSLSITEVFIHPFAGVLSAFGMGLADISAQRILAVEATLDAALVGSLVASLDGLAQQAETELLEQGLKPLKTGLKKPDFSTKTKRKKYPFGQNGSE